MTDACSFTNGRVFTGQGPDTFVAAFTIEDGRFTWVGAAVDAPPDAVDLGGAVVLPGLLDVHTHPVFSATLADDVTLLQPVVTSRAELLAQLRTHPAFGEGPDHWVMGFGYNEDKYPDGAPTRYDLDEVSRIQPVVARRADGHTGLVNSFALELAGITAATPDPAHGEIGRFPDGTPNGILSEMAALSLVLDHRPAPDGEHMVATLASRADHYYRHGITAVDDLYGDFITDPLTKLRAAADRGWALKTGVFLVHGVDPLPDLTEMERAGDVHIAGVKIFLDGAYSSRTAWVEDPYPGSGGHGIRTAGDDDLLQAAGWARANGVQMAVHVMGDRAINRLLDLFADAEPWLTDRASIRLDHATLFTPAMIERVRSARMNFGIVTHSVFFFAEYDSYAVNLSPEQFAIAYPIRSLEAGLDRLALASDAPATAWADCDDVFLSVCAAVTRRAYNGADINQAEAISVGQALWLYTGRAASLTTSRDVGLIAPRYDGNFVVLDRDPFAIPVEQLDQVRVAETWVRGRRVF